MRLVSEGWGGQSGIGLQIELYASLIQAYLAGEELQLEDGRRKDLAKEIAEFYLAENPDAREHDLDRILQVLKTWREAMAVDLQSGLAQFSLAPHLIVHDGSEDFVVGNFPPGYDPTEVLRRERLRVREDFGDGVLLLEAESP